VFDLTDMIGPDFNTSQETSIDLGIEFTNIESASIELSGVFTPGLMTPVTIPEFSGPVLPNDTVFLLVRLGEEGSAGIDKLAYVLQDLQGFEGVLEFDLPIKGSVQSSIPTILPGGEESPDFDFMIDGRFGLSAGSLYLLALIYQELVSPKFELEGFQLTVVGTAVPEPNTGLSFLLAFVGAIVASKRSRRFSATPTSENRF
jgi:hypothetical protein